MGVLGGHGGTGTLGRTAHRPGAYGWAPSRRINWAGHSDTLSSVADGMVAEGGHTESCPLPGQMFVSAWFSGGGGSIAGDSLPVLGSFISVNCVPKTWKSK